jgi:hypothetical protein
VHQKENLFHERFPKFSTLLLTSIAVDIHNAKFIKLKYRFETDSGESEAFWTRRLLGCVLSCASRLLRLVLLALFCTLYMCAAEEHGLFGDFTPATCPLLMSGELLELWRSV